MSAIRNDVRLPAEPAELLHTFVGAFNDRNLELLQELFEPEGMHVREPGVTTAGARRRAALPTVLRHRIPIAVSLRNVYVVGDIALVINDYVHDGVGPDGVHVHIEGTATDVARRGADGCWRYVISNPSGTS